MKTILDFLTQIRFCLHNAGITKTTNLNLQYIYKTLFMKQAKLV